MDGQQRLTSLTLLLIFLHHRQKNKADPTALLNLIHSTKYGQKSFNIDAQERTEVVKALLEGQEPKLGGASESVRNITDRYETILDHFPEDIEGPAVVYFVGWLLENVYLVEIEAFSDEDAYTIFETMSLHPQAYLNNPTFNKLITDTKLTFRDYASFGPDEQAERQELYLRLAEWVWNPSRLDLDGEKPPVPDEIAELADSEETGENETEEAKSAPSAPLKKKLLSPMLEQAAAISPLHSKVAAGVNSWVGVRRHEVSWNFVSLETTTRVELYIQTATKERNKAIYDSLAGQKNAIEAAVGQPLDWE